MLNPFPQAIELYLNEKGEILSFEPPDLGSLEKLAFATAPSDGVEFNGTNYILITNKGEIKDKPEGGGREFVRYLMYLRISKK